MEAASSLACSQEPTICLHFQTNGFNVCAYSVSLISIFYIFVPFTLRYSKLSLVFRRKQPWLGTFSFFRLVRRPFGKEAGCVRVEEVIMDVQRVGDTVKRWLGGCKCCKCYVNRRRCYCIFFLFKNEHVCACHHKSFEGTVVTIRTTTFNITRSCILCTDFMSFM